MNERIRQLADQAGLKSEIMLDDSSRDVECFVAQYDGSTPSIHYWEKFAELIVKETMQVVANNLPQNTYLVVADAVIEHFKE